MSIPRQFEPVRVYNNEMGLRFAGRRWQMPMLETPPYPAHAEGVIQPDGLPATGYT
jgi:hypothetical protein